MESAAISFSVEIFIIIPLAIYGPNERVIER